MRLNLITPPAVEPVTQADVEGQCRTGSLTAEAATIARFISAVRQRAEAVTRRQLITATWDLVMDGFPLGRKPVEIPLPPLRSITSIVYLDQTGATQTLDPTLYRVIKETSPIAQKAIVLPTYGQTWPTALDDIGTVTIRFVAGYGPSTVNGTDLNVPEGISQWILLNVANLYENRETETVASGKLTLVDLSTLADGLLDNYRVYGF